MKAKELSDLLIPYFDSVTTDNGYSIYKPRQYIKINEDVLMYIQIYLGKNDSYIWHATYPLFENDIWLGSGAIAERIPEIEGSIKVGSFEDLDSLRKELIVVLNKSINYQKQRSTIEKLEASIPNNSMALPLFIKGICLAYLKDYDKSKELLESFVHIGLNFGESKQGAENILDSFEDSTTTVLLETNKSKNIKKLKLKKFL